MDTFTGVALDAHSRLGQWNSILVKTVNQESRGREDQKWFWIAGIVQDHSPDRFPGQRARAIAAVESHNPVAAVACRSRPRVLRGVWEAHAGAVHHHDAPPSARPRAQMQHGAPKEPAKQPDRQARPRSAVSARIRIREWQAQPEQSVCTRVTARRQHPSGSSTCERNAQNVASGV